MDPRFILQIGLLTILLIPYGKTLQREVEEIDENDYRLDNRIVPSFYNITIKPYLLEEDGDRRFTFDGEVYINLATTPYPFEDIRNISVHCKNLTIESIEFHETKKPEIRFEIISKEYNSETNKLRLDFNRGLVEELSYTLYIKYTGIMNDDNLGFYKSSYFDENGRKRWIGSTQLQKMYARQVFPCLDEPRYKAVFKININRHKTYNSVSNTKRASFKTYGDRIIDTFLDTPKMSTYLVAFVVSQFEGRSDGEISIYSRPDHLTYTRVSFATAHLLLAAFDNFTAIPYYSLGNDVLQKTAIPDFNDNGMENWGLINYKERLLTYIPGSTPLSAFRHSVAILSHEMAHLWFGNLVTCEWWGWFWVNEGFARYFEYFMAHNVHPVLEMDKQFVVDQMQNIFETDSTINTTPMTHPNANSPKELAKMMFRITYYKGASIIRMISHSMGKERFQLALQDYLNKRKFTTATPSDLFTYFRVHWSYFVEDEEEDAFVPIELDEFFEDWTEKVGYPVVNIYLAKDGRSMLVNQERFLLNKYDGSLRDITYTTPFTFTTDVERNFSNTIPRRYLERTSERIQIDLKTEAKWVVVNLQQAGYYRVNYDATTWSRLRMALMENNWSDIHVLNRAQMVDDLLNFARAGILDYRMVFDFLEYLKTETHYVPWAAALNGLQFIAGRIGGQKKESMNGFVQDFIKTVYDRLEFKEKENDSALDVFTRNKVLPWACKYGHLDCIHTAQSLFTDLMIKNIPISVNLRSTVYCSAMRDANNDEFEFLFKRFKTEKDPAEKYVILGTLGCVRDPKLVEAYFKIIMTDEIRFHDKSDALKPLYTENPENISPMFKLVTENSFQLSQSMDGIEDVASVISNIASHFTTDEQLKDLKTFTADNRKEFGESIKILENAIESVENNLKWSEEKLPALFDYMSTFTTGKSTKNFFNYQLIIFSILFVFKMI